MVDTDESIPCPIIGSEDHASRERNFFEEMEDNIIHSFSGVRSGERSGDEDVCFTSSDTLLRIAHSLSRDGSKSPALSCDSEDDVRSRQKFLEKRFIRNTFDPEILEKGKSMLAATSNVEDISSRPRSAESRYEPAPQVLSACEDMGHLSRRIYMGRDVSNSQLSTVDPDDMQIPPSFGKREVLNSSFRRSGASLEVESNSSKRKVFEMSGTCQPSGGPAIVSPYMVSRFIAMLIRNLMLDNYRLSWSTGGGGVGGGGREGHEFIHSTSRKPKDYNLFYRPGYFDCVDGTARSGSAKQSGSGGSSGSGKDVSVDIHAFNAAFSRNEELPPDLEEIVEFFHKACAESQMEYECAIISLIYIERVIEMSNGAFKLNASNWKGLVLACMLLSSKVWDDFHIQNIDYTDIFFGLALERINDLEVRLLQVMNNDLWVSPSQYAAVHFRIQEMFTKEEINKVDAERHLVRRRRSNIRRKKPSPVTNRSRAKSGHGSDPPSGSRQIHCIASHDGGDTTHNSSGDYGGEKSSGAYPGLSLMGFIKWVFVFRCGSVKDIKKDLNT